MSHDLDIITGILNTQNLTCENKETIANESKVLMKDTTAGLATFLWGWCTWDTLIYTNSVLFFCKLFRGYGKCKKRGSLGGLKRSQPRKKRSTMLPSAFATSLEALNRTNQPGNQILNLELQPIEGLAFDRIFVLPGPWPAPWL